MEWPSEEVIEPRTYQVNR